MAATPAQLEAVRAAAERLLAARADQMVTPEEWAALEQAVAACGQGS